MSDYLDDDGYPTEDALLMIEDWPAEDMLGWFKFIEGLWRVNNFVWSNEGNVISMSTAGWSGNEDIIHSMQNNYVCWTLSWVQSRRGGHYIFELKEFKDE